MRAIYINQVNPLSFPMTTEVNAAWPDMITSLLKVFKNKNCFQVSDIFFFAIPYNRPQNPLLKYLSILRLNAISPSLVVQHLAIKRVECNYTTYPMLLYNILLDFFWKLPNISIFSLARRKYEIQLYNWIISQLHIRNVSSEEFRGVKWIRVFF